MSALDGSHRSVRGLTIATHGPRCRDMLDVIGSLKKGGPEMCPQLVAYNACRVFGALRMSTETRTRGIASVLRADGCVALEEEAGEGWGVGERGALSTAERRRCRRTAEREVEAFERELAAKWATDGTARMVTLTQTKVIATLGKHCAPTCAYLRSSVSEKPLCFIDRSFAPIKKEGDALLRTPVCLATEPTMGRKR